MKIVSIGRSEGCNIRLSDPATSRRHAVIKIYPLGKMEIVDLSQNGTTVNGVRLRTNTPTPVKRNQIVRFAENERLDWSQVPDSMKYWKLGSLILLILAVILLIINFINCEDSSEENGYLSPKSEMTVDKNQDNNSKDSVNVDKSEVVEDGDKKHQTEKKATGIKKTIDEKTTSLDKPEELSSEQHLPSAKELLEGDGLRFRSNSGSSTPKNSKKGNVNTKEKNEHNSSKTKDVTGNQPKKDDKVKDSSEKSSKGNNNVATPII